LQHQILKYCGLWSNDQQCARGIRRRKRRKKFFVHQTSHADPSRVSHCPSFVCSHSRNCKSCKTFNSVPTHTSVYAPSEQPSFRRQVCCNSAQALERRMSHLLGCNISCCFLSKSTWTSKRVLCNHGAGSSGKDEPCSRDSPSIAPLFRLTFISLFLYRLGLL